MTRYNFILALLISIFIGFSVQQTFAQKTTKIGPKGKMIELPKPKPKSKQTPKPTPIPKELSFEVKVEGSGKFECEGGRCSWSINRKYSGTVNMGSSIEVKRVFFKAGLGIDYNWHTTLNEGKDMFVSIEDTKVESYVRKKKAKDKDVEETLTYIDTWTTDKTTAKMRGVVEIRWDSENLGFILGFAVSPDALMTYQRKTEPEQDPPFQMQQSVFQMPHVLGCLNSEIFIPLDGIFTEKTASFNFSPPDCKTSEKLLLSIPETSKVTITVTYKFR